MQQWQNKDRFGYRELEESRVETLHHMSPEIAKCETPKTRNMHIDWRFGYRELEESRVETLQHRRPEIAKCETPKIQNRHFDRDFRYRELEMSRTLAIGVPKRRNGKRRNMLV
jgi:hypothetical protein